MNGRHADGVLGSDGGEDAGAIDTERLEGLQVCLDAGATPGVRAGDGQGNKNGCAHDQAVAETVPVVERLPARRPRITCRPKETAKLGRVAPSEGARPATLKAGSPEM